MLANSFEFDETFVPADQAGADRLHAFRFLAHAEIETFIENVATTILDVTEQLAAHGQLTHSGHHLLVFREVQRATKRDEAGKAVYPWFDRTTAINGIVSHPDELKSAVQQHRSRVESNHGVTAKNLRHLLLPLGFREGTFGGGFLNQLNDFGASRGSVAHNTGIVGATNLPTASTEWTAVRAVLPGLELIDRFVSVLLRPI